MPDPNGSRKITSKNEGMKKAESSKMTHSSSLKTGDKRKADREAARSPPRRRAVRRSRSSSSGTSDSSSSRSGSADSSASDSSRSGKRSPQKPSQQKQTKGSEGSKGASRSQASKAEVPIASKSEDARGRRELPKKPSVSGDGPKAAEITRTDVQPRSKPAVTEDAKPTPPLSQSAKVTSGASDDKSEPAKSQPLTKPSTKPTKPNVIEHDKTTEEHNKSPVNIPPFTRVLVEKLTRNVTKAHVTEIFSVWGEVSNVEMPPDRLHPEFSRSYAYVTYANPKCAADAVNYMNGGQVDGETIRVTEVFSRPSTTARTGADTAPSESTQSRDRPTAKRDSDRPMDSTRGRKDGLVSSSHHRADGTSDRARDYDRPNEQDRRREAQDKDRRDRDRERERQRDRSRDLDRPRRARRGSSGSPFANRLGAVARQRSPVASTRYRRASPLSSRQDAARRGRSRSPKPTKPGLSRSSNDTKPGPRRGRATSRSSSSSSSDSGSSNSSSSSHSGSSSSSSSSSSSRSRS